MRRPRTDVFGGRNIPTSMPPPQVCKPASKSVLAFFGFKIFDIFWEYPTLCRFPGASSRLARACAGFGRSTRSGRFPRCVWLARARVSDCALVLVVRVLTSGSRVRGFRGSKGEKSGTFDTVWLARGSVDSKQQELQKK